MNKLAPHAFEELDDGACAVCGGPRRGQGHFMQRAYPSKAPPRHEALRLAGYALTECEQERALRRIGGGSRLPLLVFELIESLAKAVGALAEECEQLNRSKAEDSHGH